MRVEVMSFGFKYHSPPVANFVFDVRGLKNPYNVEKLRDLDGRHSAVKEYVLDNYPGLLFMRAIRSCLHAFLPHCETDICIAIGCTSGTHRSVAVAEDVVAFIQGEFTEDVTITHRELRG